MPDCDHAYKLIRDQLLPGCAVIKYICDLYYVKQIKIDQDLELRFSFGRIFPDDRDLYLVSVRDKNGTMHSFHMEQQQGSWKITSESEVPDWIRSVEPELHKAIIKGPFQD